MKALILMGGYGTRLRPLTLSVPKPLISFCNKPILQHQIEALVKVNVDHVILAIGYQASSIDAVLDELRELYNIRISCSVEEQALGTAGPLRLARNLLMGDDDKDNDSFFVLNSDIICNFPFEQAIEFHRKHTGLGTVVVTPVNNPDQFGVILSDEGGRVTTFAEKPQSFIGNTINAGLYILRKDVLNMIQDGPMSIEREVFPRLVERRQLYCFLHQGYWTDIGQPKDFLRGIELWLKDLAQRQCLDPPEITQYGEGTRTVGHVLIHPSATIGKQCIIGPNVTIASNCVIEDGVRIKDSALMEKVSVKSDTFISGSILGWESRIGRWVHIHGLTVVGRDVTIAPECFINQATVLPHKPVTSSIVTPGQIIM